MTNLPQLNHLNEEQLRTVVGIVSDLFHPDPTLESDADTFISQNSYDYLSDSSQLSLTRPVRNLVGHNEGYISDASTINLDPKQGLSSYLERMTETKRMGNRRLNRFANDNFLNYPSLKISKLDRRPPGFTTAIPSFHFTAQTLHISQEPNLTIPKVVKNDNQQKVVKKVTVEKLKSCRYTYPLIQTFEPQLQSFCKLPHEGKEDLEILADSWYGLGKVKLHKKTQVLTWSLKLNKVQRLIFYSLATYYNFDVKRSECKGEHRKVSIEIPLNFDLSKVQHLDFSEFLFGNEMHLQTQEKDWVFV